MKGAPSQNNKQSYLANKKPNKKWVKLLRIATYVVSVIFTVVGACLIKSGARSTSYANGTASIKTCVGELVFYISLIILCINIFWGILRWFLHGYEEKWKPGRIIGKLIGGGIWRIIAFASLIIISAIFISPKISDVIIKSTTDSSSPISLSEKFDRLQYINDNLASLNYNEIKDELSGLMFSNVEFDVDASGNLSKNNSIFFQNAYAYNSTVTTLNKAKLSNTGKFVIFYTDTGDDKISDEQAAKLANMMDEIIIGYKDNLGFNYEYERLTNNLFSISKMQKVLENSGINKDVIDSAMPVYIVDPYKDGSSTIASYAGKKYKDLGASILVGLGSLFGVETAKLYSTTPSYPFINIRPQNIKSESLPIITAHELGHHYAAIYNDNVYGKTGSNDDFVGETAPNWMAINVLPNQPHGNLINNGYYNKAYLSSSTGDTISQVSTSYNLVGYPAVAFLQNYYEIVPDSKTIIMDAVYHGDALNYLYNHAGIEQFRKVMISLAEKNLTGDYGGKLVNTTTPSGNTLSCSDICTRIFYINPAATGYTYFSTDEYMGTTLNFTNDDGDISASILGKNMSGDWEIIQSNLPEIEFVIDDDTAGKFEALAIAVANYSITDSGKYTIGIVKTELDSIFTEDGDFDFSRYSFSDFYSDIGAGCYEIDTNALFDNLTSLVNLGSDFIGISTRLGEEIEPGTDLSSVRTEYEKNAEEAKSAFSEAKNGLSPYRITICGNYITKGRNFDTIKSQLQASLDGMINMIDEEDGDDRFSIFVGFDLFAKTGRIYVLAQLDGEMGLITINVEEK